MAVQERSLATRAALLDAALECLIEKGYSATTTIETARRAGVSRGAQLHHFPTRAELLAALVEHLFERRLAEFRDAFEDLRPGVDLVDRAIDVLWSMFDGPTFVAWAELWVAARTDSDLAVRMVEIDSRFRAATSAIYQSLFEPTTDVDDFGRDLAFSLMTGVAMGRLIDDGWRQPKDYLDALKFIYHTVQDPGGSPQ